MNAESRPLPAVQLENIDGAIVRCRVRMEIYEALLDREWATLGVLAEVNASGCMTLAQREALR